MFFYVFFPQNFFHQPTFVAAYMDTSFADAQNKRHMAKNMLGFVIQQYRYIKAVLKKKNCVMFVFLSTNTNLRSFLHHNQLVHGAHPNPFFVLHLYFYQQTQIQNGKKYKPAKFVSPWRPRGGKGRSTHVGPQRPRWSFGEHTAEPADQNSRSLH